METLGNNFKERMKLTKYSCHRLEMAVRMPSAVEIGGLALDLLQCFSLI
jgi:hypothetical protein